MPHPPTLCSVWLSRGCRRRELFFFPATRRLMDALVSQSARQAPLPLAGAWSRVVPHTIIRLAVVQCSLCTAAQRGREIPLLASLTLALLTARLSAQPSLRRASPVSPSSSFSFASAPLRPLPRPPRCCRDCLLPIPPLVCLSRAHLSAPSTTRGQE